MKLKDIIQESDKYHEVPHIVVSKNPEGSGYYAVDEHSYDGAPDGNNYIGHGDSPEDAIDDLCNELQHRKLYSHEELELGKDQALQRLK